MQIESLSEFHRAVSGIEEALFKWIRLWLWCYVVLYLSSLGREVSSSDLDLEHSCQLGFPGSRVSVFLGSWPLTATAGSSARLLCYPFLPPCAWSLPPNSFPQGRFRPGVPRCFASCWPCSELASSLVSRESPLFSISNPSHAPLC